MENDVHQLIKEIIESCELIEDKEDNNQLIEDKIVENDAHQLIKEIIESCELIEYKEDINELNEYLEIIFTNPHQLKK